MQTARTVLAWPFLVVGLVVLRVGMGVGGERMCRLLEKHLFDPVNEARHARG